MRRSDLFRRGRSPRNPSISQQRPREKDVGGFEATPIAGADRGGLDQFRFRLETPIASKSLFIEKKSETPTSIASNPQLLSATAQKERCWKPQSPRNPNFSQQRPRDPSHPDQHQRPDSGQSRRSCPAQPAPTRGPTQPPARSSGPPFGPGILCCHPVLSRFSSLLVSSADKPEYTGHLARASCAVCARRDPPLRRDHDARRSSARVASTCRGPGSGPLGA